MVSMHPRSTVWTPSFLCLVEVLKELFRFVDRWRTCRFARLRYKRLATLFFVMEPVALVAMYAVTTLTPERASNVHVGESAGISFFTATALMSPEIAHLLGARWVVVYGGGVSTNEGRRW